jgi:DNA-binding response OmpR family regulator
VMGEKELKELAEEHGADDYLSKSTDMHALALKVQKLLTST